MPAKPPAKELIAKCACGTILRASKPKCRKCGGSRPSTGAHCCDPLDVGCVRPTGSAFMVGVHCPNPSKLTPCQSCRYQRARQERLQRATA